MEKYATVALDEGEIMKWMGDENGEAESNSCQRSSASTAVRAPGGKGEETGSPTT
jgi:hypothetical protein